MRLVFGVLAVLVLAGCDPTGVQEWRNYHIFVESIDLPGTIAPGDTLHIAFEGFVGPNTCHRFHEFRSASDSSLLEIIVVGRYERGTCPDLPVFLDGETYSHPGPFTDPFTVAVIQPTGAVLEREVRVQ